KAARPGALDALPVGKHGRGRLLVDWGDRDAAKQLVASLVRRPAPHPGTTEGLPRRVSDPARVRLQVMAPAVGLFLTAIVAVICAIILANTLLGHWHVPSRQAAIPVLALSLTASAFLLIGAVRMMMR